MATRVVLILLLIFFASIPTVAQIDIGFGPQLGIYKIQDVDGVRFMGGAAVRLRLSELLGVEVSVNYREEEYGNGSAKLKSWPVMVTGLVYPIPFAYGAIGAGWYNTSINYSFPSGFLGGPATLASETKQEFGWHFGGGVEFPVGSFAKVVGDIRYVFLDYDFSRLPGSDGVNSNFYVVTAGFLFNL